MCRLLRFALFPALRGGMPFFAACLGLFFLCSCVALQPREEPGSLLTQRVAAPSAPSWAKERLAAEWWRTYRDESLNQDVETALSNSPRLAAIGAQLKQAEAQARVARVAAWPRLNLGYGYRAGRVKEVDFGPYDLAPWTGAAQLQWEIDLWGKLRQGRQAALNEFDVAGWDLASGRLILASETAEARFRVYRLSEEIEIVAESIKANGAILRVLRDREKAGLIAMTDVHRATAEHEKLKRGKEELSRLKKLAIVELETLLGGENRDKKVSGKLPKVPPIPQRPLNELLQCHPTLLAAEARVRAAFGLEEAARLDLLPSIQLRGNLSGASPHFFLDEFRRWERSIGPSLDVPVFDPARRASLHSRRAKTDEASQLYRAALVKIIGEVDSAYVNLESRRRQFNYLQKEVGELAAARREVEATFRAGIVSQIEVLESERSYLQAQRALAALHQSILNDHLALIRALGGGGD